MRSCSERPPTRRGSGDRRGRRQPVAGIGGRDLRQSQHLGHHQEHHEAAVGVDGDVAHRGGALGRPAAAGGAVAASGMGHRVDAECRMPWKGRPPTPDRRLRRGARPRQHRSASGCRAVRGPGAQACGAQRRSLPPHAAPHHHHARRRAHRRLLHAHPARAAQPRPRRRHLLAAAGARGGLRRGDGAIPHGVTDMREAIAHPATDVVVVALPNHLHEEAVMLAARAGKAVLCTKPLGRTAEEALADAARWWSRRASSHGYLEDLCYTPKTLKAIASVRGGRRGPGAVGARPRDPSRSARRLVLGPSDSPGAGPSSTSAATASRSSATSSARETDRSR